MKKIILLFILSISFLITNAQWLPTGATTGSIYYNNGNVGIGTGAAVNSKFEVRNGSIRISDVDIRYLNISHDAQGQPYGRSYTNGYAGGRQFKLSEWSHLPDNSGSVLKDIIHFDGYNLLLLKDNGGSVGIGTITPASPLHLYSLNNSVFTIGNALNGYTHLNIGTSADANGYGFIQSIKSEGTKWGDLIINKGGGNVGIGTINPGSFKLAVEGKIGAREVNVTTSNPWPDYVFETSYQLPTLEELNTYIKENKHLPEVPSACVMEDKGIDLGEMNMLLLKKVEELTLYNIQQNEEIKLLNARLQKLESK